MKILLVDDDQEYAETLQDLLKDSKVKDIELFSVDRLQKAFDHIRENEVDVVLLDLGLPDSQGIETLRKLRAHSPNLPVVVLTGLADEGLAVEAVKEGAHEYLIKGETNVPLLLRILRSAVIHHENRAKASGQNKELKQLESDIQEMKWRFRDQKS